MLTNVMGSFHLSTKFLEVRPVVYPFDKTGKPTNQPTNRKSDQHTRTKQPTNSPNLIGHNQNDKCAKIYPKPKIANIVSEGKLNLQRGRNKSNTPLASSYFGKLMSLITF